MCLHISRAMGARLHIFYNEVRARVGKRVVLVSLGDTGTENQRMWIVGETRVCMRTKHGRRTVPAFLLGRKKKLTGYEIAAVPHPLNFENQFVCWDEKREANKAEKQLLLFRELRRMERLLQIRLGQVERVEKKKTGKTQ